MGRWSDKRCGFLLEVREGIAEYGDHGDMEHAGDEVDGPPTELIQGLRGVLVFK